LTNDAIIELGEAGLPSVRVDVLHDGKHIRLVGTHPLPPGSSDHARLRNEQLRRVAGQVHGQDLPVVVLGDLNTTPWSPFFSDLLREGGLQDTSAGRGIFASWPSALPFLRIPLDHCLVSPGFAVCDKRVGPRVGGDHLPIVVTLQRRQNDHNTASAERK
jgi:endonuclease/exonuclease/phosphatase (EEP) superfamily protein YafD